MTDKEKIQDLHKQVMVATEDLADARETIHSIDKTVSRLHNELLEMNLKIEDELE